MRTNSIYALILMIFPLLSCSDDDDSATINPVTPETYTSENFTSNVSQEALILTDLSSLTSEIQKGRAGTQLTMAQLEAAYTDKLRNITSDYYRDLIVGNGNWLDNLAKASANTYTPGDTTGEGGVFGAYLFDENGLELEQMIEKGLFGAALYNEASQILDSISQPQDVDRVLALFGGHPSFPNTDNASSTTFPDRFMARYAARRDKNDGQGLYSQIKSAFIRLRVATEANPVNNSEIVSASNEIKALWEKINAATVINYCLNVQSRMSATSPSDADKANALHAYGEAVGFTHGWRNLPASTKLITDLQIDEVLALLKATAGEKPMSYVFITEPANNLADLQTVVDKLQGIYGFTDAQVDDFSKNWVSEQNR